jgi:hypothetical protein
MKRFLACLALCASLSASAQDDNCTVLGVQDLSSLYSELSASIDTIVAALSVAAMNSNSDIVEYTTCSDINPNFSTAVGTVENCVNERINQGYTPFGAPIQQQYYQSNSPQFVYLQALVKYAED